MPPGSRLCPGNLRRAWQQLKEWGSNGEGREAIREAMQLCPAANLADDDDVDQLAQWAQNSFDYLVSLLCAAEHLIMQHAAHLWLTCVASALVDTACTMLLASSCCASVCACLPSIKAEDTDIAGHAVAVKAAATWTLKGLQ